MGDHQHPREPAERVCDGHDVERGEPGFPKARGHGDEGF